MRRSVFWAAAAVVLAGTTLAVGTPLDPTNPVVVEDTLEPYAAKNYWRQFEAGRRAEAVALGDGTSFLTLYVYDAHGNCVAWDDRVNARTRDDLAAEWLPPRTGPYTIEVKCLGRLTNKFVLRVRQHAGR